jgi:MFS family permease
MTIPPYVTACILTIAVAHLSDRFKRRGYFIAGALTFALIGFIIAITTAGNADLAGVTYAGCFIACCGFFPAFPGVISWLANNLAGPYKRAIAMSLQICKGSFSDYFGAIIAILIVCGSIGKHRWAHWIQHLSCRGEATLYNWLWNLDRVHQLGHHCYWHNAGHSVFY